MNFFAVVIAFVVYAYAVEQDVFKLPLEKILNVEKVSNKCAQELNVDPGLFMRIPDGTLPKDEASLKYLYCVTTKVGLVSDDGHMVVDKMTKLLGDHPRKEEFKEAIEKCNEITKADHFETVGEMNRCLATTAPIRFDVSH